MLCFCSVGIPECFADLPDYSVVSLLFRGALLFRRCSIFRFSGVFGFIVCHEKEIYWHSSLHSQLGLCQFY